jgi:hypothetical protein
VTFEIITGVRVRYPPVSDQSWVDKATVFFQTKYGDDVYFYQSSSARRLLQPTFELFVARTTLQQLQAGGAYPSPTPTQPTMAAAVLVAVYSEEALPSSYMAALLQSTAGKGWVSVMKYEPPENESRMRTVIIATVCGFAALIILAYATMNMRKRVKRTPTYGSQLPKHQDSSRYRTRLTQGLKI